MLSRVVFFLLAGELAVSNPLSSHLASIWEERRELIIAVCAVVAVQSALIAGLLVYHAALRRAKREGQGAHLEMRRLQNEIAHVGRVSMMGQLASSLAHEINQPLGAILRNAEAAELFLESENPDLEEIRTILADIRADDQRAGSVIDRMRSLLKRHVLDTQVLDLSEVVDDVAQLARADAAIRRVKLTVEVPEHLPPVQGDRVHLQQVLLNLIVNGMDALNGSSPENRRVTVSARVDAARGLEVSVSDSGHGIATEKLPHVFEPFYTTKKDGMGMGLPISRTIVESHGGRLWVDNNNSTGATFRFTLPLAGKNGAS
jgi:two-component system sensor kinase FixL